jgi:putative two-component system response regulator
VIVLTASRDKDAKVQALKLGASDFLEKPIQPRELLARVHNTLLAKAHVDMLKDYSSRLEYEVQARTTELMASRREAVQCLARAAELRDDVTGRHVIRVGRYAAIIAEELGFSAERINWMEHAAQLHDVGKIGIPDAILHKPGRLTEEEFGIMQGHCVAGRSIIRDEVVGDEIVKHRNVFDDWTSPMMHLASVVAATHHEKWDGTGYPQGLQGTDIPIEGRITAIADVFDALSTTRPYKAAIPLDECFCLMEEKRGTHFDPDVLDAFFRRRAEIIQTAHDYADRRDVR